MSHGSNGNIVTEGQTYILAGYRIPCNGTVVAWEFCYRISNVIVNFYPGIWRKIGTNDSNASSELIQSNNVIYNASIKTSVHDGCQRVNLSMTDQFTAPAGSVVGLYSGIGPQLLRTNNSSSVTTYHGSGNHSSVNAPVNGNDVNYNIAIKVYLGKYSGI